MKTENLQITWLGHSTFRIDTPQGKTILIDPWVMGNPACPNENKRFDKIDLMLCTHGHFDHIGDAVTLAKEYTPQIVAIFELGAWLEKKGATNINGMNKGGTLQLEGVKITMVHADHSCGITDDDGTIIYGGEPCGYVLEFDNGLRLYHSGDTNVFGDMRIIHELYAPEVALLPIGDHFTMGPREVAYACGLLRPKVLIPMHFGTFPLLHGNPKQLEPMVKDMGVELMTLKPGERRELRARSNAPVAMVR